MKKVFFITLLLAVTTSIFGQQTSHPPVTVQTDYLKKSRRQSTAAWILLGGGVAINLAGALLSTQLNINGKDAGPLFDEKTDKTGSVLSVIGFCSVLSSIPFFIVAHGNKKKHMNLSFKTEPVPKLQHDSFVSQVIPALAFKISL